MYYAVLPFACRIEDSALWFNRRDLAPATQTSIQRSQALRRNVQHRIYIWVRDVYLNALLSE